jgi:hypothetical protein
MPFSFQVTILDREAGSLSCVELERRTITMSRPSQEWDVPQVHTFMNRMCAVLWPPGTLFLYNVAPAGNDLWEISVVRIRGPFVSSQRLALSLAVVDELGRTERQKSGSEHRPYAEEEARGGLAQSTAEQGLV